MYTVAYAPCGDYDYEKVHAALETALDAVTDFAWLKPGMRVAVKVNLVAAAHPDKAATTHPAVVRALCAILTRRGAQVVVGDSPGGPWNATLVERVYRLCGLREADLFGATLNRDFSEVRVTDPAGKLCREFDATGYLTHADAVISLCKLKAHGMMTLTGGVKNLFGAVPGTKKPEYHFRYPDHGDFADMLVDICQHFSPVLTICDAVVAMEGNGPTAGTPRPVGYLAAATDPHALDASLARLVGLTVRDVPTLAAAQARGLLSGDAAVLGQPEPIPDFHIPQARSHLFAGRGSAWDRLQSAVLGQILRTRPQVRKKDCVGCGLCADVCPAKAIVMREKLPVIARKDCIRCFCCQEFCPQGAMRVHRTPIARLLNKEVN